MRHRLLILLQQKPQPERRLIYLNLLLSHEKAVPDSGLLLHKIAVGFADIAEFCIADREGAMIFSGDLIIEYALITDLAQCLHDLCKIDGTLAERHQVLVGLTLIIGDMDSTQLLAGREDKLPLGGASCNIQMTGIQCDAEPV